MRFNHSGIKVVRTRLEQPMMDVWSHRPQILHLALFFAAYVLGCGFAQALAIVPGITVSIWPPGGVFIATLILTSPYSWPWWVLAGCLAEMTGQLLWFHSPPLAGFLIYVGNALCAIVGATLVNRAFGRPIRLESLREVLAFVVLGAGVAPLVSATVGSATLAWFGVKSQTFAGVWPLFWIGDATGILLVAPLALVVIQHWRSRTKFSAVQWVEAGSLGLIFLGIAALSLKHDFLLSAYIIMPPILWAAVRFEFKGVAVALTLLALITMALTISGGSQFVGDPESQKQKQVMLQLFLAISAFSALIVAAISRQHQQALLALRDREQELSQLVDMVPVHIRRLTPEGKPTFFNKRLLDFFGMSDVAQLDKPDMNRLAAAIQTLVHPDDAPRLLATAQASLASGESFSMKYRMRRADGAYRWVDGRGEAVRDQHGTIVQWYAISIDVDDEMRAQEELRDRERELSQLVDMVPSLLWRLSPNGEPNFFNKRTIDFLGLDVADYDKPGASRLRATLTAIIHPDDAAGVIQTLNRCLVSGAHFSMQYRLRRADGLYRWVSARAEPLRDESGHIVQWYGLAHDIDDQMRAEEALRGLAVTAIALNACRSLDEVLRTITDRAREIIGAHMAVIGTTVDQRWAQAIQAVSLSQKYAAYRGFDAKPDGSGIYGLVCDLNRPMRLTEAELQDHPAWRGYGVHADQHPRLRGWLAAPLIDSNGRNIGLLQLSDKDQGDFTAEDEGIAVQLAQMASLAITEARLHDKLRLAQETLARASQAASLAELSASVAHEVNQPLAAVVANSHACQRWLMAEPPNLERAQKTVERIIRDANSAADVVSRIRALFKQSAETRTSMPLDGVITEALNLMAEETARRRVRLDVDVERNLPLVSLDRVQIQQVLVNLVRNGMEAMDAAANARVLGIRTRRLGDVVQTEITDQGPGVAFSDRIFEPFFTTKGNGMGMGLAICRSIVEAHGGRLWADKNEPNGAMFVFTLPVEMNRST